MFDRPGLILYVLCAAAGPSAGYALANHYGGGWDAKLMEGGIISLTGLVLSFFLAHDYDEYKALESPSKRVEPEQPKRTLLDMNKADGFALTTQAVKIDVRRNFAITLIRMLDYNGHDANKLDLTEDFWLGGWVDSKDHSKGKHPKRWKGKNKEFRDCMHDWDGAVFQKSDPTRSNSRYTLRDEMELKRKADGR